jgi:5-methylcytosine-specific restriction enzyme subunit McrC
VKLLYPSSKELTTSFGKSHKGRENKNLCKLGFVNVLDNMGKLDLNIGTGILEKLE